MWGDAALLATHYSNFYPYLNGECAGLVGARQMRCKLQTSISTAYGAGVSHWEVFLNEMSLTYNTPEILQGSG